MALQKKERTKGSRGRKVNHQKYNGQICTFIDVKLPRTSFRRTTDVLQDLIFPHKKLVGSLAPIYINRDH